MLRSLLLSESVEALLNYGIDLFSFYTKLEFWRRLCQSVVEGLRITGLGQLWGQTLFHVCLFRDLILLACAQKEHDPRRERLRFSVRPASAHSSSSSSVPITSTGVSRQDLHLGERYVRYAQGIYGKASVAFAEQLTQGGETAVTVEDSDEEALQKYLQLRDKDVWYADFSFGESSKHIRHAVMVDHSTKQVVVTIRGTYSITSALVSLACFSKPFHGGQAHGAAADMAMAIWEATGPIIETKIASLPVEYGVVFTGHSLGGAVACLLTIHLYALRKTHQLAESMNGRSIQCYAYGPPSCFSPCTAAPEAIQNTVAFVHNMDIVPSISVHSIRLFFAQLSSVRETARRRSTMLFPHTLAGIGSQSRAGYSLWSVAREYVWHSKPAPARFRRALERTTSDKFKKLEKAPMLEIPARVLVWLEQMPTDDAVDSSFSSSSSPPPPSYEVHGLNPRKYADRPGVISSRMMADHKGSSYAAAFATILCQQQQEQNQNHNDEQQQ